MASLDSLVEFLESVLKQNKDISVENLASAMHILVQKEKGNKSMEVAKSHAYLVGKCFKGRSQYMVPEADEYIKVINYRSFDENKVECLVFSEDIAYMFKNPFDMFHTSFFGQYEFDGIVIEDREVLELLGKYDEISPEEYKAAMHQYVEKLAGCDWAI